MRAAEVERLVWDEIARFAQTPGKLLGKIQQARLAAIPPETITRRIDRQLQAKQQERVRVVKWAREERSTEAELDTQLVQLRAEVLGLEAEQARLAEAQRAAATMRAWLADAEAFFDELAGRLDALTDEQRAQIMRQLVPRVVITPRSDGRVKVAAT